MSTRHGNASAVSLGTWHLPSGCVAGAAQLMVLADGKSSGWAVWLLQELSELLVTGQEIRCIVHYYGMPHKCAQVP